MLGKKHHFNIVEKVTLLDLMRRANFGNEKAYELLKKFNDGKKRPVFISYDQNQGSVNMYRKPIIVLAQTLFKTRKHETFFTGNRFVFLTFRKTGLRVVFIPYGDMHTKGVFNHLFVARQSSSSSIQLMTKSSYEGNNIGCIFYK